MNNFNFGSVPFWLFVCLSDLRFFWLFFWFLCFFVLKFSLFLFVLIIILTWFRVLEIQTKQLVGIWIPYQNIITMTLPYCELCPTIIAWLLALALSLPCWSSYRVIEANWTSSWSLNQLKDHIHINHLFQCHLWSTLKDLTKEIE